MRDVVERLAVLGLRPEDFEEKFIRSSGHGGQNVNKVSTAVWLRHRPTGLFVKAMEHRTQAQNREAAWRRLLDALEAEKKARVAARKAQQELQRRRHRRPSAAARARNAEEKRSRGRVKALRQRPGLD